MPPTPRVPSDVVDMIGRGGTVVTGNQRAARTLRLAYDRDRHAGGLATWQPPAIFAWDTWTASLYRQLLLDGHATRFLLNRTQELQLWRSAVEADRQWSSLQTAEALAAMAADAWQLLCAYRGRQRLRNLGASGDVRSFQRWAQTFTRRCSSSECLSVAELEETLIAAVDLATTTSEILLLGFDSKTPAQQGLIEALRHTGVRIDDSPLAPVAERLHLTAAESPGEELAHAALWIRDFVTAEPHATVAVIFPGLAGERREIDRVFRHILAPELEDITASHVAGPYEFSLGHPLANSALVFTAIQILRLASGAVAIADVSRMLLSAHFAGGQNELSARAEFDAFDLRKSSSLRPEITLNRLIELVSRPKYASQLAGLRRQLRSLERTALRLLAGTAPRQRPYTEWAEAVRELLQASGWPGSRALDSLEFQTRQKFDAALDELATLDFEGTRTSFEEALAQLEGILRRTLFAPESRQAPIQIMSPFEAAGSHFDALCFLRASDLGWPVRPAIHPLLGWSLQRELGMPGSAAALDFAHARRVTGRLAASAGTVFFSYARQTEDSGQRPSALLAAFGLKALDEPQHLPAREPIELESFEDDTFLPLSNLTVHGGAGVLKSQAACGFRAFAEHRLRSAAIETPEPGMDALERGTIVHAALEHLWSDLRTQAALRALTPEQREAQLSRSIEHSLRHAAANLASDRVSEQPAEPWPAAYLELQRLRLHRVLAAWLEKELERPAFEVAQREQRETVGIGTLALNIRVDRVDRMLDEAGGTILIDYKTGSAKPSDWAGARPDEPQLPLYAVLREADTLAGVAFANIRAGDDLALQGYAGRAGILPKFVTPPFGSLGAQLENWRRVLTALAEDFAAGDARVDPKSYPKTCIYCEQRLLCRLDPGLLLRDEDVDEGVNDEEPGEASGEADA